MGMESRLWNSPPSCGHGVQTEIQGLVGTPLCPPPRGSRGVVLLSSKVWNGRHGGEDLAIGITCFTTPPPLTGDQTHKHTHTHNQTLTTKWVALWSRGRMCDVRHISNALIIFHPSIFSFLRHLSTLQEFFYLTQKNQLE
jgi:hypothetical protein